MSQQLPIYVVYLFHFAAKVGNAQHYVGSTTTLNFDRRMRDHSHGRASALTAEAVKRRIDLWIARTWFTSDRGLEQRIKSASRYSLKCPICKERVTPSASRFQCIVADPQQPFIATATLEWQNATSAAAVNPQKKGRS